MTDRRRCGVIEVRRINADTYHLTIGGRAVVRGRMVPLAQGSAASR